MNTDSLIEEIEAQKLGIYFVDGNPNLLPYADLVNAKLDVAIALVRKHMGDAAIRKDAGCIGTTALNANPANVDSTSPATPSEQLKEILEKMFCSKCKTSPCSCPSEIPGNEALVSGIDGIALSLASWVEFNQMHGEHDDQFVITPPCWPTIGTLKAWIVTLVRAQRLLSEQKPVSSKAHRSRLQDELDQIPSEGDGY